MPHYLTFALVAPLAAFGSIAVGERRGGWDRPGRSAVLGLIGACLGLEREDEAGQAALAEGYGLAMLCVAPGALLADYHTAQVPSAQRGRRFATRAEELAAPGLNTILSRRDYRSGAWHLAALWPRVPAPRWGLEAIAEAMRRPVFTPYLGRKSCPLGLPLAPELVAATDAPAALLARHASEAKEGRFRKTWLGPATGPLTVAMEAEPGGLPAGLRHLRTERRRDQPRSRRRWQFDLREELILAVPQP
ncbi:type I-E CRISPR-associated protein Cas5/CasD [Siccirubricoccus phaeus]|uniref:type I-E CRISPR-associated protein Cas5/CasD n=1 Tax=Siccirubricoccus phaeus TaxID=2595053 RepID=UPI0011F32107|nr:type I-E CRISPR-associated protein Cas5/CasD [Siccirubricoccus phaeus]